MQCSAKVSYEEGVSSTPGSCRTPESFRCFWASLPLLNDLSVKVKVYSVLERFDPNPPLHHKLSYWMRQTGRPYSILIRQNSASRFQPPASSGVWENVLGGKIYRLLH